ncbi:MAG: MATE family efflux transporter [Acidobacteria bacterium]|nr:MATE family efflux transporter [Acidobacteriota bacterium]
MSFHLAGIRRELGPMTRLATPVVVAEVGWVTMGLVDIAMVGRLGPAAIGAVGIGSILFIAVVVFGIGTLLGLDPLVAQAAGAGRRGDCHRWLFHGAALAVVLALPLTLVTYGVVTQLPRWGLDPEVERLAAPYAGQVLWSILPLLLYTAFRRYLQAIEQVAPVMVALVTANLVNVAANWVLVFGHLGFPSLGINGAAWATCVSRLYMAVFLLVAILRHDRREGGGLWAASRRITASRLGTLTALGLPAAAQITLEVGVFAVVTALAGRFDPTILAAHQIVLNIASVTFMVPLGIGAAGAVRVGHGVGRRDPEGVRNAGWAALALGAVFMTLAAVLFIAVPSLLLAGFTTDPGVVRVGVSLLFVAAWFQLFDGLQGVATGVLRGFGDTRTPMLWNLAGHWAVGLPVGAVLGFGLGWGVVGLWVGLSIGLVLIGTVLVTVWTRRIRAFSMP